MAPKMEKGGVPKSVYILCTRYLPPTWSLPFSCPCLKDPTSTHFPPLPLPFSTLFIYTPIAFSHRLFVCLGYAICVCGLVYKGGFRKARSYVTPASGPSDFGRLHNIDSLHLAELHFFLLSRVCSLGFPLLMKSLSYFLNLQRRKCHSIRTGINCPRGRANWRHMVSIYFNFKKKLKKCFGI